MSTDDEVLNPGFFDHDAQRDPAWLAWSNPARISEQVDRLFAYTLPAVPDLAPMPTDADRYSDKILDWVADGFEYLFPDEDALFEPENAAVADQFVCYIGEALRTRAGGRWFNQHRKGADSVLFGMAFTPSVGYDFPSGPSDITDLMFSAVEAEDGPDWFGEVASEIYSRTVDYAREHGIPHDFDAVRQQHNLT